MPVPSSEPRTEVSATRNVGSDKVPSIECSPSLSTLPRSALSAQPIQEIGDYEILVEIGRGGVVVVHRAQKKQSESTRR